MNPIKESRIKAGVTQEDYSREIGMTPNSLKKYELGLYINVSPKIIKKEGSSIQKAYTEWQREERASNAWRFDPLRTDISALVPFSDVNPMSYLMELIECPSAYALSTWLLVHQDSLGAYCKPGRLPGSGCRKMPKVVRSAFLEVLPLEAVTEIETLVKDWSSRSVR